MNKFFQFINQLRVEPFVFFYMFSMTTSQMIQMLLGQDKFCVLEYKQSYNFCINFNQMNLDSNQDQIQSQVLIQLTKLSLYATIINIVPLLIWSLFIGSWCDKYIHGRKCLMLFSSLGLIFDMILVMINAYYFELSSV